MNASAIVWNLRLEPEHSLVHLETTLVLKDGHRFELPAWIPGSYMVREFVRGLQDLEVRTLSGEAVTLEHPDKASWVVRLAGPTPVRIRYAVFGHELTVRTAHIDNTHAFFNGANVFLRFEGRAHLPQRIAVQPHETWETFISLPLIEAHYQADDYVHLADTVFEFGPHPSTSFEVDGIPHRMIFWGADGLLDTLPRLVEDTKKLIVQNRETFQSPLPYARYDIVYHVTPTARGGLEHRDSTTLATPWSYFESEGGYLDMLTLIAHEHFHAYNGRRLAPKSLQHIDYSQENYTQELWVIEGFTSYFDELNTFRAGLMTEEQWLERTAKALDALFRVHGRERQSLTEASHDAWIRLYRPYAHTRNQTVSYYLKGSLVALAIDLNMRLHTHGERGLDDVLQSLWTDWQEHDEHYTTDSVLQRIGELSQTSVADEARRWVTEAVEPPYQDLLASHGILWTETPATAPDFGVDFDRSGPFAIVQSIDEARQADVGAFFPGDELVSLDGRRVSAADVPARLQALQSAEGREVTAQVFRLGRLQNLALTFRAKGLTSLATQGADDEKNSLRQRWWQAKVR